MTPPEYADAFFEPPILPKVRYSKKPSNKKTELTQIKRLKPAQIDQIKLMGEFGQLNNKNEL